MKAVVLARPGAKPLASAVKLDPAFPVPKPKAGQALVSIESSSCNPVDVAVASGAFGGDGAAGKVMASDFAGVVEEVVAPAAAAAPPFKKGDRVWALTPYFMPNAAAGDPTAGCWAERCVADAAWLAPAPPEEAMPLSDAGAGPLVLLTAWQALEAALGPPEQEKEENEAAPPEAKRRCLITAASGGVGHVAVQLAKKAWGCGYVVGVASARNRDFVVRELGADACVDYADEAEVSAALGEGGAQGGGGGGGGGGGEGRAPPLDAAVDLLGGPWTSRLARALAPTGGTIAHVMCRGSAEAGLDALKQAGAAIETIFVRPDAAALGRMARMIAKGELKVHVAARYPLERAGEALEAVAGGHTRGKVVVTVA
jgi:NADPH:quinone reductase-like Zn-dependent oxidoreductase